MLLGNVTTLKVTQAGTDWHLTVSTIVLAIAVLTIMLAIKDGRVLSKQLELLRKQVFGEIYETSRIRDLQFFLPAKKRHDVRGFEQLQHDIRDIELGKEVQVRKSTLIELHIRFWWDAPQKLRYFAFGFLDNYKGCEYSGLPTIDKYLTPFKKDEYRTLPREIYRDWNGFWHIEYGYERFAAKNDCLTVCFSVEGKNPGKFPLHFEVSSQEAEHNYEEVLWVEIIEK